ncbi:choice-of-anchor A family protein [Corallincola platygyrae]|uniref:Choice-of-anchor A family protein n=1 Tax=Corallincola platygyrae TaxID=1193278 RepID=A0ABW4XG06_9GAMM
MPSYFKHLGAALVFGFSINAQAMPLSDYNLILLENYNFQGGDVEGKTFIGGDLNAGGYAADFGSRAPSGEDSLSVVGDINASNLNIQNGNLVYGSALNVGNVNMNGGGTIRHDPTLSITGVVNELIDTSFSYSNMSANGFYDAFSSTLTYTGNDAVAVFDVAATEVFAQNTSLRLDSGNADTVIINLSGVDITAAGGVNLVDGFHHQDIGAENILWNFYEAEAIDFNNLAMFGSVLATFADITGGAVFDGAVAARSYTGGREFHNFLFNPPTVDVNEPVTLGLFGLGLLVMGLRRKARS